MLCGRARHHPQTTGLEQRPVVGGLDLGQRFDVALDEGGESPQDWAASRRPERRPRRKRPGGGGDGGGRRRGVAGGDLAERRAVDRTRHRQRPARADAPVGDEVIPGHDAPGAVQGRHVGPRNVSTTAPSASHDPPTTSAAGDRFHSSVAMKPAPITGSATNCTQTRAVRRG